MEDYFEKYTLISDNIKNQLSIFCNEADKVKKWIDNVDSAILKSLLTSIDNICTDICNNLIKISNLNLETIKLSMQYQEELYETTHQHRIQLSNQIDNINKAINNEPKFMDIIKFQVSMAKHTLKTINQFDKLCDTTVSFIDFQNLTNLKIFQINIMQCCLPFSINDYGEYEAKKQQIRETVQFTMGLVPILSEISSFVDFVSIIEKAANIENYDDLKVNFYNTTDDNLKMLEKQLVMLDTIKKEQKAIVTYFEDQLVIAQERLKRKNTDK